MPQWNTYQRNPFTPAKEVIGETLEYLDHSIKKSAFHPRFNPSGDKEYAAIQCVHHDENGMHPLTVTHSSGIVLDWLKGIKSILVPNHILFFRFTYDEQAKSGSPKWGIEWVNEDKSSDNVPGLEYTEPEL